MKKLTEKQLNLIKAYKTNGGNKVQAYKSAYNCDNMLEATAQRLAVTEFDKPHIKSRIEQAESKLQEKFDYTLEEYVKELEDAIDFARGLDHSSSVVSAVKAKGAAFGFDKKTLVLEGGKDNPLQIIVNSKKD